MTVVVNGGSSGVGASSGSAIPTLVSTITTGSGTFTPQSGTQWMRVTLVGGGGGGSGTAANGTFGWGGGAGGNAAFWIKNTAAPYAYSVGVGGTAGALGGTLGGAGGTGGATSFGSFTVAGGCGANGVNTGGGMPPQSAGYGTGYGCGGGGGTGNAGYAGSGGFIMVEEY